MKLSAIVVFLLAISYASSIVPLKQLYEKAPKKEAAVLSSESSNIPYCGTYDSGCTSIVVMSVTSTAKFKGSKGKTPTELEITGGVYDLDSCQENNWKYNERNIYSLTPNDNVFIHMKCEKVYITLSPSSVQEFGCANIKANKEYDVSKTKCINSKGEDEFQTFRDNIGDESDTYIEFKENSVNYSFVDFQRVSSSGCSMLVPIIIIIVVIVIIIIVVVVVLMMMNKKKSMPKKK